MTKKRVSIKDIAEIAGVSHPTVSRALRGQGRMSVETRARIVSLAEELGYTPSLVARGLVTQRSYSIGLVVPTFINMFNSAVAQGIEQEARKQRYSLFLACTDTDPERELEVIQSFMGRQVDGIIVASGRVGDAYAQISSETGVPIVLINVNAPNTKIHAVYHDDYAGACSVVNYLIKQGRSRIAYLGAANEGRSHADRRKAWIDTMREAHLEAEVEVDAGDGDIDGGVLGCQKLLAAASRRWNTYPDAICCFNDMTAIGAMSVLRRRKLRIPDSVAITGFDDIELAAVTDPPMTTVRQPLLDMGYKAMTTLVRLMDPNSSTPADPVITYMPGELIVRESA